MKKTLNHNTKSSFDEVRNRAVIVIVVVLIMVLLHGCTKQKPAPPPAAPCECAKAVSIPPNPQTD